MLLTIKTSARPTASVDDPTDSAHMIIPSELGGSTETHGSRLQVKGAANEEVSACGNSKQRNPFDAAYYERHSANWHRGASNPT